MLKNQSKDTTELEGKYKLIKKKLKREKELTEENKKEI
jgi:hypothetical protein